MQTKTISPQRASFYDDIYQTLREHSGVFAQPMIAQSRRTSSVDLFLKESLMSNQAQSGKATDPNHSVVILTYDAVLSSLCTCQDSPRSRREILAFLARNIEHREAHLLLEPGEVAVAITGGEAIHLTAHPDMSEGEDMSFDFSDMSRVSRTISLSHGQIPPFTEQSHIFRSSSHIDHSTSADLDESSLNIMSLLDEASENDIIQEEAHLNTPSEHVPLDKESTINPTVDIEPSSASQVDVTLMSLNISSSSSSISRVCDPKASSSIDVTVSKDTTEAEADDFHVGLITRDHPNEQRVHSPLHRDATMFQDQSVKSNGFESELLHASERLAYIEEAQRPGQSSSHSTLSSPESSSRDLTGSQDDQVAQHATQMAETNGHESMHNSPRSTPLAQDRDATVTLDHISFGPPTGLQSHVGVPQDHNSIMSFKLLSLSGSPDIKPSEGEYISSEAQSLGTAAHQDNARAKMTSISQLRPFMLAMKESKDTRGEVPEIIDINPRTPSLAEHRPHHHRSISQPRLAERHRSFSEVSSISSHTVSVIARQPRRISVDAHNAHSEVKKDAMPLRLMRKCAHSVPNVQSLRMLHLQEPEVAEIVSGVEAPFQHLVLTKLTMKTKVRKNDRVLRLMGSEQEQEEEPGIAPRIVLRLIHLIQTSLKQIINQSRPCL
jgi:hypothetical protein